MTNQQLTTSNGAIYRASTGINPYLIINFKIKRITNAVPISESQTFFAQPDDQSFLENGFSGQK